MKMIFEILFKKLYIFAVLFGIDSYLLTLDISDTCALLINLLDIILMFAYWILMPIAFKTKSTLHSFGHFASFEFAVLYPIRNVHFDGMAGIMPFIAFGWYLLVIVIGMIVLAITNSIRQNNSKPQEEKNK